MAHYQLANVLLAMGDLKGAVEHFEAFVKYSPKDPKAKETKQTVAALKEMLG
jgi:TolA-binding protein